MRFSAIVAVGRDLLARCHVSQEVSSLFPCSFISRTSYPRPPLRVQKVTELEVLIAICMSKLRMVSDSPIIIRGQSGFYLNYHFFIGRWTTTLPS